jgi:hypothetical protein
VPNQCLALSLSSIPADGDYFDEDMIAILGNADANRETDNSLATVMEN